MLLLIVKADMYICSNSICLLAHLPNATETPRAPVQNNYGDLFQNYSTSVEASACKNRYDAFIRIHICVRFEPQACIRKDKPAYALYAPITTSFVGTLFLKLSLASTAVACNITNMHTDNPD